jgi:hypothetical protein
MQLPFVPGAGTEGSLRGRLVSPFDAFAARGPRDGQLIEWRLLGLLISVLSASPATYSERVVRLRNLLYHKTRFADEQITRDSLKDLPAEMPPKRP